MADLDLRDKHPRLHYRAFGSDLQADGLHLRFEYDLEPDWHFTTHLLLSGVTETQLSRISPEILNWYLFHIGLVESFSYWKLSAAPEIVLEAGFLTPPQEAWWHDLLIKGMGEYFYVNDIDFTAPDFVRFVNTKKADESIQNSVKSNMVDQNIYRDINILSNAKIMVPIGGGKDSIISVELLKQAGFGSDRAAVLELHPTLAAQQVAQQSGLPQIKIERTLDSQLMEMNEQGYLNGHTPFSALLAFLTNLTALIWDYQLVAVSNERSSNEGNVRFLGQEINHQYSKTYEFETKFREYLAEYGPDIAPSYFSFVRPLYELQIAQIFSQMTPYHAIFRSCNVGRDTNAWCGHCAKCLFAYLILGAVMPISEVKTIFGQDLLVNLELKPLALELLGYIEQKPLECVGTREESKAAAWLIIQQYQRNGEPLPTLLADLHNDFLKNEVDMAARSQTILNAWNDQHHLPPELATFLQTALKASHDRN